MVKINFISTHKGVAPGFKDKNRYTPYVSPGSQISHIATSKDVETKFQKKMLKQALNGPVRVLA